jgi:HlyD family secretion protein
VDRRLVIPLALVLVLGGGFLLYKLFSHSDRIVLTGFVEGEERILRSKVTGRVESTAFEEGQPVSKGETLLRIDDREIKARLAQAQIDAQTVRQRLAQAKAELARMESQVEGSIASAKAVVDQMRATHEWSAHELLRHRRLHEQRVVSAQLLDKALLDERQAQANLDAAVAQLAIAQGNRRQVDAARENVRALEQQLASQLEIVKQVDITRSDYTVKAPFDGTVETKYIFEGELATPGSPLAGILRPQDRYVRVYIPVTELDHVRVGTPVRIELDAAPGVSYAGRITFIANQTQFTPKNIESRDDRVSQVYEAKATILEGRENFKPGAEGNVYVEVGRRHESSTPVAEAMPGRARP